MSIVIAASLGDIHRVESFLSAKPPLLSGRSPQLPGRPDSHWVPDSAYIQGDIVSDAFYGACRNGLHWVAGRPSGCVRT